jgi:hypothetical protein
MIMNILYEEHKIKDRFSRAETTQRLQFALGDYGYTKGFKMNLVIAFRDIFVRTIPSCIELYLKQIKGVRNMTALFDHKGENYIKEPCKQSIILLPVIA